MLELLPFTALSLVLVAHHDQALVLVGRSAQMSHFAFRRKERPLGRRELAGTIGAFVLFVAIPYVEEFVRCARFERAHRERRT